MGVQQLLSQVTLRSSPVALLVGSFFIALLLCTSTEGKGITTGMKVEMSDSRENATNRKQAIRRKRSTQRRAGFGPARCISRRHRGGHWCKLSLDVDLGVKLFGCQNVLTSGVNHDEQDAGPKRPIKCESNGSLIGGRSVSFGVVLAAAAETFGCPKRLCDVLVSPCVSRFLWHVIIARRSSMKWSASSKRGGWNRCRVSLASHSGVRFRPR
jgi:hypothetical protein